MYCFSSPCCISSVPWSSHALPLPKLRDRILRRKHTRTTVSFLSGISIVAPKYPRQKEEILERAREIVCSIHQASLSIVDSCVLGGFHTPLSFTTAALYARYHCLSLCHFLSCTAFPYGSSRMPVFLISASCHTSGVLPASPKQ